MGKIIFDYGHGGKDGGASFEGRLEKNDVMKLGQEIRKDLIAHGVEVDETRIDDKFVSLSDRCKIANSENYDFFISFHRNAFNGIAKGCETYTYTKQSKRAKEIADSLNKVMVDVGFENRGVKKANFQVLRGTKTTAVLLETGFIDNPHDNYLFDSEFYSLVYGISNAIMKLLDINNKKKVSDETFRVVCGSYKHRENAERQVEYLKSKGIDSFIDIQKGG